MDKRRLNKSSEPSLRLPKELIEPPQTARREGADEFHKGIGRVEGHLLMLLDLELLLGIGAVC